jgi:hypothetical protein
MSDHLSARRRRAGSCFCCQRQKVGSARPISRPISGTDIAPSACGVAGRLRTGKDPGGVDQRILVPMLEDYLQDYHLDKAAAWGHLPPRQAGAEIEITSEMIEAGALALWVRHDPGWNDAEVAAEVYKRMEAVRLARETEASRKP